MKTNHSASATDASDFDYLETSFEYDASTVVDDNGDIWEL